MTTAINQYVSEAEFRRSVAARFAEPQTLPVYTIATLPAASLWPYAIAAVSDGMSHRVVVVSDGTNWRYSNGGAV